MKIGFVGLGNMGAPMAKMLVSAGHTVRGFDISGSAPDGVHRATSVDDAADQADFVITMLPDGPALSTVAAALLPALDAKTTLIDCSTIDVATSRSTAESAAEYGVDMLDAPVSGGTVGAAAGTLTFMVGGSEAAYHKAEELFSVMGNRAVYCGTAGAGQAAKICNNMILGATMAVTCEAFALAEKLGLGADALYQVVSTSSGQSWSTTSYCPVPGTGPQTPADDDYRPGFAAALMRKDLQLSQGAAKACGARTQMGASALSLYDEFLADNGGEKDFSAVFQWLAERS